MQSPSNRKFEIELYGNLVSDHYRMTLYERKYRKLVTKNSYHNDLLFLSAKVSYFASVVVVVIQQVPLCSTVFLVSNERVVAMQLKEDHVFCITSVTVFFLSNNRFLLL